MANPKDAPNTPAGPLVAMPVAPDRAAKLESQEKTHCPSRFFRNLPAGLRPNSGGRDEAPRSAARPFCSRGTNSFQRRAGHCARSKLKRPGPCATTSKSPPIIARFL